MRFRLLLFVRVCVCLGLYVFVCLLVRLWMCLLACFVFASSFLRLCAFVCVCRFKLYFCTFCVLSNRCAPSPPNFLITLQVAVFLLSSPPSEVTFDDGRMFAVYVLFTFFYIYQLILLMAAELSKCREKGEPFYYAISFFSKLWNCSDTFSLCLSITAVVLA